MNVLLLQQIFRQAEKWHLDLDADLANLENRFELVFCWCGMQLWYHTMFQKDFLLYGLLNLVPF